MAIRRLKRISDQDKGGILKELKALLYAHDEISFALLYGSMVNPVDPERYGDVDIAIYVKREHLQLPEFILESQIEAEAYRLLAAKDLNSPPIEISVINNAPCSFLVKLFKGRYIVLKENDEVLTDFIDEVGGRAMANSYLRSESLREMLED
jgi:predicted nucleotidyltransferase